MSQINPSNFPKDPNLKATFVEFNSSVPHLEKNAQRNSAAYALHMTMALANTITTNLSQMKNNQKFQYEEIMIRGLSQGLESAQNLVAVNTALENLLKVFPNSQYPQVNNWLNEQLSSVQASLQKAQDPYNKWQQDMKWVNNQIEEQWPSVNQYLGPGNYTYNDFYLFMTGQGDPSNGQKESIGDAIEASTLAPLGGLYVNNGKVTQKYNDAQQQYGIYTGYMKTGLEEFTNHMGTVNSQVQQPIAELDSQEKTLLQNMQTMVRIVVNLSSESGSGS